MRFHLFLLIFFSYSSTIFITRVYSTKSNSLININLYQCHTNTTSTTTIDTIGDNLPYSCSIDCCTLNSTTSTKVCQVSVQSSTGVCRGRLCYPDECEKFTSVSDISHDSEVKNTTKSIMNQLGSSFASIQTQWSSLVGKTGLTARHAIITILLIVNISLTSMTLIIVIKSIRQAKIIAEERSYRYTLL